MVKYGKFHKNVTTPKFFLKINSKCLKLLLLITLNSLINLFKYYYINMSSNHLFWVTGAKVVFDTILETFNRVLGCVFVEKSLIT